MKYEIVWTKKADESYKKNIKYLEENWSEKVIEGFINKTDKQLALIADFPYSAIATPKSKNLRKILIVKQISCFYSINENKKRITVHLFWNNYQNPKKLKL
jgi:plasmid stabilization system protein ParE